MYFLYILHCADNSLYTGITNDLEKRFANHANKKGSKYVASRLPFKHIYTERFQNRSSAQKREFEIKKLPRKDKIRLLGLDIQI